MEAVRDSSRQSLHLPWQRPGFWPQDLDTRPPYCAGQSNESKKEPMVGWF